MILDLTQLGIAQSYDGTVTFLGETAGFLNVLGMYRIDAEGVIYDVEIIFANASAAGSGGDLTPGVSMTPITLQTSDSIGFFILPNGWSQSTGKLLVETAGHFEFRTATGAEATISDLASPILCYVNEAGVATAIKSQYGTTTFHSAASADTNFTLNGDALNHVRFSVEVKDGKVLLSMTFEDLWKGGDKDYNDVEFRLDLGAVNTVALAPELAPLLPKLLTTEADLAIVTAKGERSIDLLSNDSFAATAPGARITHISGQAISEGQTITLASGERLTLLKDGVIRIEATATSGSTEVTYFVADDNGGFGVGTLKIVTDAVDGTSGNDQMHVGYTDADGNMIDGSDGASEAIYGYGGNDKITAGEGDDVIDGGDGDDFMRAGAGDDLVKGGAGNDVLDGQSGADTMDGGLGNDVYWLDNAGDVITETNGGGYDKVLSQLSHSLLDGFEELWLIEGSAATSGTGNALANKIVGNANANLLTGGNGADTLFGEDGDDQLFGGDGSDHLHAGSGSDTLDGGAGKDKLYGSTGGDALYGGADADQLTAGSDGDILSGGAGNDLLSGGTGADVFVFAADGSRDTVKNFTLGIDTIDLGALQAMSLRVTGATAFLQIDATTSVTFSDIADPSLWSLDTLFA
jgi:Ca2+-binding RTX toxin-like protein